MSLDAIREEIDSIDSQMLELFCRRLDLAADVAAEKAKDHKPVFDPARERTKLLDIAQKAPERLQPQAVSLFSLLMSMNKAEQQRLLHRDDDSSLSASARASLKPIDEPFPATAMVACQGVEGAYSQSTTCLPSIASPSFARFASRSTTIYLQSPASSSPM